MAEFTVTATELKNKAGEIRQLNETFRKTVEDMQANEQKLMGMWDGEAKENFHAAFMNDKGQMDTFYNEILKYCTVLENNAVKYETAEQKNVGTATNRTYR